MCPWDPLGFISTSVFAKAVPCRCLTTTVCLGSSAMPDRHKLRRPALGIFARLHENVPGSFSFRRLKIPKTMAAFDLKQDHLKTTRWDTPIWKKLQVLPSNHRVRSFPFMETPSCRCWRLTSSWPKSRRLRKIPEQFPSYLGNVHCYHVKHAVLDHIFESVWSPHWTAILTFQ